MTSPDDEGGAAAPSDVLRPARPPRPPRAPRHPAAAANAAFDPMMPDRAPAATPDAVEPAPGRPLGPLYTLTLLSAVDGTLVVLAASGRLADAGTAALVGLTVIAGAGSWLAAQQAFGGRLDRRARTELARLGLLTMLATVASAMVGTALGSAVTLHVLPKAAGAVLCLVAAELAGVRLPRTRVPMPLLLMAAALALEVGLSALS